MVTGFNHNLTYKGELFHVQTEDSGLDRPHIVTLLYRGGVIIASTKTSYADIVKIDKLESIVEELMKEQHKEMMRRLKGGAFDEKITARTSPKADCGAVLPDESPPMTTLQRETPPLPVLSRFSLPPEPQPVVVVEKEIPLVTAQSPPGETCQEPPGLDAALRAFFGPRGL